MTNRTAISRIEELLRKAGRECRRVTATYRFHGEAGVAECQRLWEPYAIRDGVALVFSYLKNEFRTIPLRQIVDVEIRDRRFVPRRPIEL